VEECNDNICFVTETSNAESGLLIKMRFSSKIDTILRLNDEIFTIGCSHYLEPIAKFNKKPELVDLKHSQIVLENEDGDCRVYSSQFVEEGKTAILILPNCSEMEEFNLSLFKRKIEVYEFVVTNKNDMKVKISDRRIKLHLYLKNGNSGGIIHSSNWINL
jgi:hypothetical protein